MERRAAAEALVPVSLAHTSPQGAGRAPSALSSALTAPRTTDNPLKHTYTHMHAYPMLHAYIPQTLKGPVTFFFSAFLPLSQVFLDDSIISVQFNKLYWHEQYYNRIQEEKAKGVQFTETI